MSNDTRTIRLAGSNTVFVAREDDNLLRAGLRAGIGLPYECNAGGCGSCKFELVGGEIRELWPLAPGLSAKDRQRGRHLACQCVALTDCEIKIRLSDSFIAATLPERFNAQFLGSQPVTADIREFRFRGPGPARFAPGQYALLTLVNETQPRAYSMSNLPDEEGEWAFMVRRVPGGKISPVLFDAMHEGDSVAIDGPLGFAHWRPDSARDIVCIAGGSGIAPIVSIANASLGASQRQGKAIWLFYGGRSPVDIPAFDAWLHDMSGVKLHAAISAQDDQAMPQKAWTGERGFIHEVVGRKLEGDMAAHEYYLAGPPPMIETLVRMLIVDHKVPSEQIHYDRFF